MFEKFSIMAKNWQEIKSFIHCIGRQNGQKSSFFHFPENENFLNKLWQNNNDLL